MFKVFTIGDSLTAGFPGYDPNGSGDPKSSYQYWLEKKLSESAKFDYVKVYNFGVPGISSKEIFNRLVSLSTYLEYKESEVVIVNGGGNDWQEYERIDDSILIQNLVDCCNYALKDDIKVI